MKNKQVCFSRTQNKEACFSQARNKGFSLIELLIVVTIVGMLSLLAVWAFHLQVLKGRDARRKADLAKLQMTLEDYLNDNDCYPASLECNQDFLPYLSSVPCDPVNSRANIYYYSVSQGGTCKRWYKIFTNLENKSDPVIEKIGCTLETCGPFNYVVSSPNMEVLVQQLGEIYPPSPPGVPLPTSTPGGGVPTSGPTLTPTPTIPYCAGSWFGCKEQGGYCNILEKYQEGAVCDDPTCNKCEPVKCRKPFPACTQ